MILTQEHIQLMSPGLWRCPFHTVVAHMPRLKPVMDSCPVKEGTVDVKVHMLMPGQYPCIPNWHYDFVPRDDAGQKLMHKRDPYQDMYLWVSGPPFPEFEDGRAVWPEQWLRFSQFAKHRGTESEDFTWRVFVRVAPEVLCPPAPFPQVLRRHSQVYLDAKGFEW